MNILIVEDNLSIGSSLLDGLQAQGHQGQHVISGEEAFFEITTNPFDLILLDWMLPGRTGIEILSAIRERGIRTPVIMLTARDCIEDRVDGLDAGADDYLVKPFAFSELNARIRSLVRRSNDQEIHSFSLADLNLNRLSHKVQRSGKIIDLTPREFEILEYLFTNVGKVVSREMLAKDVWREPNRMTSLDNVIDVQLGRLRRKVDQEFGKKLIHTIRGVGFILKEEHYS